VERRAQVESVSVTEFLILHSEAREEPGVRSCHGAGLGGLGRLQGWCRRTLLAVSSRALRARSRPSAGALAAVWVVERPQ
jgi:hypothetical protein